MFPCVGLCVAYTEYHDGLMIPVAYPGLKTANLYCITNSTTSVFILLNFYIIYLLYLFIFFSLICY